MEKIKQIFIMLRTCKRAQWDKCCNVDVVCDLGVQDGGAHVYLWLIHVYEW